MSDVAPGPGVHPWILVSAMSNNSRDSATTVGVIAAGGAVLSALIGVLANIASADQAASIVALAVAGGGALGAAILAQRAKQSADAARAAAENAQRQADSIDSVAANAGIDPTPLYESVLKDSRLPIDIRYVYAWSQLERAMRATAYRSRGDDMAGLPLTRLINNFAENFNLGADEKKTLRRLLVLRNSLVHGRASDSNESTTEDDIATAARFAALADGPNAH